MLALVKKPLSAALAGSAQEEEDVPVPDIHLGSGCALSQPGCHHQGCPWAGLACAGSPAPSHQGFGNNVWQLRVCVSNASCEESLQMTL